ncbi:hypothetical protein P8452_68439 [Trifolium repens]|nr:hypothetical protein P8452_68439 [Trifolium repens]
MAEFASSLIQSLGSAALREFARINGLKDELERLKEQVETSRAVLLDLDGKQEQSHAEQNLVKRLKNVLIPADDLLDEFAIHEKINQRDELHRNKLKKKLSLEVEISEASLSIAASQYSISCTPLSLQINETIVDVKNVAQYWWQNLTSLQNLKFRQLSSKHVQAFEIWFKDDINYLPSLKKITFFGCDDLKALPAWICNISSLQHIKVKRCRELALLPEGMPSLTNLHTLEIIGDSLLVEECKTKTSATWSKISHIPNIIIKLDWYYSYPRYSPYYHHISMEEDPNKCVIV